MVKSRGNGFKDRTGERHGRLTVLRFVKIKPKEAHWECRCDCGNHKVVAAGNLASGATTSCGCYLLEVITKHGHGKRNTREYKSWSQAKSRCTNPNSTGWKNYGGRGIKMCDRWSESFSAFYEDVGPAPSEKHTLDRIDVDRGYEPGNVRWATRKEQARNRRNNFLVTYKGETLCLSDWCDRFRICSNTLKARILKYGAEQALSQCDLFPEYCI